MSSAQRISNTTVGYLLGMFSFLLGGSVAGGVMGGLLGWLGSHLLDVRSGTLVLFGVAGLGIAVGGTSLARPGSRILQFDRTSSKALAQCHPLVWGFCTGALLGAGFTIRIGFWLWYIIPTMSFVLASPSLGALIYGTYGFSRAIMGVGLFVHTRLGQRATLQQNDLLLSYPHLRWGSDVSLVVLALAIFITTGLRPID